MSRTNERNGNGGSAWSLLALVSAILVGSVLVFSAYTKILSPKAFIASVESYGLLPSRLALPGATGLIGLEIALGLMLILGPGRRTAAKITLPLVLLFIGMVTYAMRAGLPDCGCFGEVIKMKPEQELVVDFVLLALTGVVLWRGRDLQLRSPLVAPTLGWGGLALGAALFLAAGPATTTQTELGLDLDDLAVLRGADPPLPLGEEAFLFFFAADCDHCWAYAGAVQLMHDRVEDLSVHGITFSDAMSLEAFRDAFLPTYPIHVIDRATFTGLVKDYPGGVWIHGGQVEKTWSTFVPSHREIAETGGYFYRADRTPAPQTPAMHGGGSSPNLPDFGGTVGGGRQ
jgi:uncharacterized membrane protein YphA (DoxX/SURF4 family)